MVHRSAAVTMAAALQADSAEREAIEKMKDEFISVVSHELRTPLTSIRGSLGLLQAGLLGPIPPKAVRMLDVALSNTDRLIRVINDVLDIGRIESGRVMMEVRPTNARDLVLRSIESLKMLLHSAQLNIVEHAEPIELIADGDRIVQTLTNLISNAIKFSPPGATIDVSARREGREGREALFTVQDRGRGIPADKLEAIFGRFKHLDASDSREKGGTGLGLAISRSIVQQHGGRMWVQSQIGQGSTFHFTLPLPAVSLPQPAEDARSAAPAILVVDDDPDVLEVVGRMLAQQGYRPIGARSGSEALALAATEHPAAILLDLAMPDMDGWEILVTLKDTEATRDIPVVVLSGLERVRDERTEQTEGWIAKPVKAAALRDVVERVLTERAGPGRILIVEDDEDLACVLRETFVQHGVETESATTGARAIALSEAMDFDLLLLDLSLADGDGYQVIDWFRQHNRLRSVPLVVYTARDLNPEERGRLQLGHTEFLTKARISPEEVQRRVLGLLQRVVVDGARRAA